MLYDLTVVQFSKMLRNLQTMLEKADSFAHAKKFDVGILLHARLAPDQHPLIFQIQFACDLAQAAVARLTGNASSFIFPENNETTLPHIQARIQSALDYLSRFTPQDFVDAQNREIRVERWQGRYLTGLDYGIQFVTPGFYFHITLAYEILRHNGVELGKKDFLNNLPFKD